MVPVIFQVIFVGAGTALLLSAAKNYGDLHHAKKAIITVQGLQSAVGRCIPLLNNQKIPSAEVQLKKLDELQPLIETEAAAWGDIDPEKYPELKELEADAEVVRIAVRGILKKARETILSTHKPVQSVSPALISNEGIISLVMDQSSLSRRFLAIESQLTENEPHEINQFRSTAATYLVFGAVISSLISLLMMLLFSRGILRRLNAISNKAKLIGAGKTLPAPDQRDDEIGALDRAIYESGSILADTRIRESAILDGTAHVICSLDDKLKIQTVGKACNNVWHFSADELLGKSLLSLVTANSVDQTRIAFDSITQDAKEGKIDIMMRCGDLTVKNMLWSVRWQETKRSFYCVVEDVTELRSVEQLRQHFFSMVSHDLRSPLTAIGLNISLIATGVKGAVEEPVKAELRKVETNLAQLMRLVNEILTLEKLEAGKSALTPRAVSAADVCESAIESLAELASECNIKIRNPRGNALLLADEEQLERAIINLLTGTARLAKPGSEVTVTIERQGSFGFIQASQKGYAIPPHEAELMFDKFRQTHLEADRPVKQAGLGFVIAKSIAEMHGGSVGVDPPEEPSGGSTIWIGIPLHDQDGE